ncbi:MAG: type IV pilus assembly protein PilM [Planctomycetes bacterium]|nr:type IV pilus assembly protein PilM [Planctomycetota bacterium]MCW8137863.1 type IV pilus assembly protein PilM [Planctomycetota bacterium]
MFGRSKRVLALDIGSSEIKAMEVVDTGSGIALTGFEATRIGSQNETIFAVKELLKKGNFKTKRCVTAVSGRSVIVRYVTMAQMPIEDLRQAIKFEADKYIPFEVDEVIMDTQILEDGIGDAGAEMKVLLVAVRKSLVEEHLALLNDAGLQPTTIDVDAFALGNAFEARARAQGGLAPEKVVALIDIGANKTNINILKGKTSYFTREVYLAGNDFTEAVSRKFNLDTQEAERLKCEPADQSAEVEEAILPTLDDLGNEIQLSFDYFENQFDRVVEEVYISGGSARLPGLQRAFEGAFEKSVVFWNPLEGIDIRQGVDMKRVNQYAGQLAVGVGLATRARGW